jgi:hypothetical protein
MLGLASVQFTIAVAALLGALFLVLMTTVAWALFHHESGGHGAGGTVQSTNGAETLGHRGAARLRAISVTLSGLPRYVLPLASVLVLVLVYIVIGVGVLMAVLTGVALLLGVAVPDEANRDRWSDIPIAMTGTWVVLLAAHTGLLLPILAGLAVPGFIVWSIVVLLRDYPLRWIAAGFVVLILIELAFSLARWHS